MHTNEILVTNQFVNSSFYPGQYESYEEYQEKVEKARALEHEHQKKLQKKQKKKEEDLIWTQNLALEYFFKEEEDEAQKSSNDGKAGTKGQEEQGKQPPAGKDNQTSVSKQQTQAQESQSEMQKKSGGRETSQVSAGSKTKSEGSEKPGIQLIQLNKQYELLKSEQNMENYYLIKRKLILNSQLSQNILLIEESWSGEEVFQVIDIKDVLRLSNIRLVLSALNYPPDALNQWLTGVCGILLLIQKYIRRFVESNLFEFAIMMSVIVNTLILTMDGLVKDEEGQAVLTQFNFAFTIIFTVDMSLKVLGLGLIEYLRDKMVRRRPAPRFLLVCCCGCCCCCCCCYLLLLFTAAAAAADADAPPCAPGRRISLTRSW